MPRPGISPRIGQLRHWHCSLNNEINEEARARLPQPLVKLGSPRRTSHLQSPPQMHVVQPRLRTRRPRPPAVLNGDHAWEMQANVVYDHMYGYRRRGCATWHTPSHHFRLGGLFHAMAMHTCWGAYRPRDPMMAGMREPADLETRLKSTDCRWMKFW